jgi:hypothetical protein
MPRKPLGEKVTSSLHPQSGRPGGCRRSAGFYPGALGLLPVVLLVIGCQPTTTPPVAPPPTPTGNTVSGKVTYRGQPVTRGVVLFCTDQSTFGCPVEEDGSYTVQNVPEGEMRVCVAPLRGVPGPPQLGAPPPNGSPAGPPGAPPGGPGRPPGPGGAPGGPPVPPGVPAPPPGVPPAAPPDKDPRAGGPAKGPGEADPLADVPPETKTLLLEVQEAYGDPEKTPLTYTVTKGRQVHDLPLK